ncbi:50S ribosomal protein L10 [Acidipropionibacterium acidipropionici ATCC 4875]|uniref:Large ribosomal subunit protein uL10 n=1 Tax=Acidipropionibacterium acidipropionici (strain ATCC 4875 / DSM 20272 / JCM 6432 / NBRC 12425 / NCIMB 8070 / 4) TaxID=1171373 RepID=K7SMH5_ACIA4|nr:50S ribosomal protein L10 [Acidipropionibacterium acidipropionici]AFV90370.1 50S ribosomal protein L10 [Acidipropionibacterium acidipropionici ATCC 4875]MDN6556082.1 50S ribosomal protein L10 [Acidipropionibacterium acidipropionici]
MARSDKAAAIASLKEKFSAADATVLTDYRGLSVAAMQTLRRSLGEGSTYAVAKNTLTRIAANEAGIEGLDDKLVGPTALTFINGDVATAAKGLRDFAKDNPLLVIKGGYMDGRVLSADEVKKLADLESREVLLAKLSGGLKANLTKAAQVFSALPAKAARGFGALQDKAAADPSVIGGAGEASDQEPENADA